jgi:hypothetical protein
VYREFVDGPDQLGNTPGVLSILWPIGKYGTSKEAVAKGLAELGGKDSAYFNASSPLHKIAVRAMRFLRLMEGRWS